MTLRQSPLDGIGLCWGCVPELSIVELAALAARHGFPEIHVQPSQYFAAGIAPAALRAQLERFDVTVGVIDALMSSLPGFPDLEDVPEQWREPYRLGADQCIEAAVELGARTLNVAHFLGSPTDQDAMAEALGGIAEQAGSAGLRLSLEFIPGTGFPDYAATLDIIRRTEREDIGVLFDTWHFVRGGGDSALLRALGADRIFEVQFSGRREPAPGETYVPMAGRLPPGQGDGTSGDVVRVLRQLRPEIPMAVEVFTSDRGDPDDIASALAAATRRFMEGISCS